MIRFDFSPAANHEDVKRTCCGNPHDSSHESLGYAPFQDVTFQCNTSQQFFCDFEDFFYQISAICNLCTILIIEVCFRNKQKNC